MVGENGTPETPDWTPEPRCCPFDRDCGVCETPQAEIWLHGSDAHLIRGDN